MSAPMKKPRTSGQKKTRQTNRSIPWREVFKAEIKRYTEIGAAVRGGRYKAGLTQKQVAERLGILPHHICEMEYGKRAVSKKMAHKLGKVFDLDYRIFL